MTYSFFLESHLSQFRIAFHQISNDYCHLDNKFPIFILSCTVFLFHFSISIFTFILFTIFFCPSHCFNKLFLIIYTLFHTTKNLGRIYRLVTHAQIFLKKIRVNHRTCYTHTSAAYCQI